MKVLLKTDIKALGRKGDIVNVSDGYATSSLLPSGKAVSATPAIIKSAAASSQKQVNLSQEEEKIARANAAALKGARVTLSAKTNGHKLFGALNLAEIAQKLQSTYNIKVEVADLQTPPIKEVGESEVTVNLGHGVQATITVEVTAQ